MTTVKLPTIDDVRTDPETGQPAQFGDLHGEPVVGPVRFHGGIIFLRGYGCHHCGQAFWCEDDDVRRLEPGTARACPHCGAPSVVPPTRKGSPADDGARS